MRVLLILFSVYSVYAEKNDENSITEVKTLCKENVAEIPNSRKYKAEWSDLDTRPLPEWYDKAKIGIFLHWGVYSVPSYGSEWFWDHWAKGDKNIIKFMNSSYPPKFTYQEFAPLFTTEFFDPTQWASLFDKAGAKYVVLTSKHHDGFTLFPSKRSFSWNSVDVGPKRDLVGDLAQAIRKKGLKFGAYHSLYEWFNPIYLEDRATNFTTRTFPETKLWPDIKQLVNDYKPSVLWSDGDWETYDTYWNSTDLLAWLYNDSPVKDEIVVNDRWGIGTYCHHGDFYNCEDAWNPGELQFHKWESAFPLDKRSWGYRRNMYSIDVLTIEELLNSVVSAVSCGGNALINVGPTKEGTIPAIFEERLLSLGAWLTINGEAIYRSSPWLHQQDSLNGSSVWYTCTKSQYNAGQPTAPPSDSDIITAIYAVALEWPSNNLLRLKDITPYLNSNAYQIQLLGNAGTLGWNVTDGVADIVMPDSATVESKHAWTLKFTQMK